ncbi:uncharacterized protein [Typha latifolia]|uniref:uncharacterized protein n=1 Tax=Typha latifolia TaxID=4733 RepID=UPI003C3001A3
MLLSFNNFIRRTHYEVLSVKEDASYDEIRANYRSAVLSTHPDKVQEPSEAHFKEQGFLNVQKAWEVLSDSKSRSEYDKELRASRQELEVLADEVELGDMSVETTGDVQELVYLCRCGDYYSVTSLELKEMGIVFDENGEIERPSSDRLLASVLLPCGSCSLKIRLVINVTS